MTRKVAALFLSIGITIFAAAQLQSPESFLGYRMGDRFTPHWKIVNYFHHVAKEAGAIVKLEHYGETNEGRPLLLAFVSSPENIRNLESIRLNNLRLANLAKDKMAANEDRAPAIVWLSYNVHGNEASSSEAALLALFALADPTDAKTKEWLKNTVVIIDPCINPDGRDRYVSWFSSVSGKTANPQLIAREHREPWPGGRTNHYNFDLNRDWAWQTQTESRQRIAVYQQWMPHIHVDYHEQFIDNPYYFAPAAQPFHEVITTWQREFQKTIGINHATYFDEQGWLYFTREFFDLFYPSYGDTWPVYNGAIGMTYEQAGHGLAGTAVITSEGDTLTLHDRILHHFTTSLSTVEVASRNAARLVKEFRKYFSDAVSAGVGEYKSYVIKYDARNAERIASFRRLLDRNGIRYGRGAGNGKGFHYASGREEPFTIDQEDIVISALQPRSAMVKVLLEPRSRLVDSATYDITAWSLPYVYGLDAYASRERISETGAAAEPGKWVNPGTSYGYVIPWKGIQTVKLAGRLLQKGILLRYAEQPFKVNGTEFDRGALLVLKTANRSFGQDLWTIVRQEADTAGVQLFPVSTGMVEKGFDFGSSKMRALKAPRVAVLTGEGVNGNAAGEVWHFFEEEIGYPVSMILQSDFGRINWNHFDVLVLPDGNYRFLTEKNQVETLKEWVSKGGRVIALESAVSGMARAELGIKLKKGDDTGRNGAKPGYEALKKFEDRERDFLRGSIPGSIYRVTLDNTHPLAFGYPAEYYTLKQDDAIYEFIGEGGWNVGIIKKDNQVAGFAGARVKEKLKDGLLFGVKSMGNGSLVFLADNVLFRSFWENGKLMFCNAVFLSGQ